MVAHLGCNPQDYPIGPTPWYNCLQPFSRRACWTAKWWSGSIATRSVRRIRAATRRCSAIATFKRSNTCGSQQSGVWYWRIPRPSRCLEIRSRRSSWRHRTKTCCPHPPRWPPSETFCGELCRASLALLAAGSSLRSGRLSIDRVGPRSDKRKSPPGDGSSARNEERPRGPVASGDSGPPRSHSQP